MLSLFSASHLGQRFSFIPLVLLSPILALHLACLYDHLASVSIPHPLSILLVSLHSSAICQHHPQSLISVFSQAVFFQLGQLPWILFLSWSEFMMPIAGGSFLADRLVPIPFLAHIGLSLTLDLFPSASSTPGPCQRFLHRSRISNQNNDSTTSDGYGLCLPYHYFGESWENVKLQNSYENSSSCFNIIIAPINVH